MSAVSTVHELPQCYQCIIHDVYMYIHMCVGYIKMKNYVAQREYVGFKTGFCWSLHEYRLVLGLW